MLGLADREVSMDFLGYRPVYPEPYIFARFRVRRLYYIARFRVQRRIVF